MIKAGAAARQSASTKALNQELRRGTLVLAVLAALREEKNGTSVKETLAGAGVLIDDGALYPMLRRLEDQGLLASEWRYEGSRNKRFYKLSSPGRDTMRKLVHEWRQQTSAVQLLIGKEKG